MKLVIDPECPTAGYVQLPKHPSGGQGFVKRNVQLCDLLGRYLGPDIIFDFDENDVLIGIEILLEDEDEDEDEDANNSPKSG